MKHILFMFVVLMTVASCGHSSSVRAMPVDQLEAIQKSGVLRVAVKPDAAPFSFRLGGNYTGFEIDILRVLARELGVEKIVYVDVASNERVSVLLKGNADMVIASMTMTRGRDASIDFSIPYFQDGQMLLVSRESKIQSYLDLDGILMGCIRGSTSEQNLCIVAPSATIRAFQTLKGMTQALQSGTIEAMSTDGIVLEDIQRKNPDAGFKLVGDAFSEELFAIAVVENQSNFRDAINNALQRMSESGEWQQIYDTWFGETSGYKHVQPFYMQTVVE